MGDLYWKNPTPEFSDGDGANESVHKLRKVSINEVVLLFNLRFLNRADFNDAFSDESYWKEVVELQNLYPERDERPGLLELIG